MSQQQFPMTPQLSQLSEALTEAHARIQQDFATINPVVGINRQMRASGIAADVITIECLVSNRRILIILKDAEAGSVSYQFGLRNTDPDSEYRSIALDALSPDQLYCWMRDYFS